MTDGTLQPAFNYSHITASAVTQLKAIEGILHTVNVNQSTPSATISDGLSGGTTTVIAVIGSSVPNCFVYDIQFNKGLTITTTAATDITVGWV